jgi:hypothetical protein
MSFTPASVYDIFPNDYYFTRSYMNALNESPDTCSQTEGSFYPPHTGEPEPFFPIHFPTPTSILARTSSVESSTSLESASTLSSGPYDGLCHPLDRKEGDHDAQFAAAMGGDEDKRSNVKRHRGPNRRRPGTGYSDLMVSSFVGWSCVIELFI